MADFSVQLELAVWPFLAGAPDLRFLSIAANLRTLSVIDLATWQIVATADATSAVGSDVYLMSGGMSNDGGFIELASTGIVAGSTTAKSYPLGSMDAGVL